MKMVTPKEAALRPKGMLLQFILTPNKSYVMCLLYSMSMNNLKKNATR